MFSHPEFTMTPVTDARIPCEEEGCTYRSHSLLTHVFEAHGMTPDEYLKAHKGAATLSQEALEAFNKHTTKRTPCSSPEKLEVTCFGIVMKVDAGMPASECKDLPEGYMEPSKGKAKSALKRLAMGIARRREDGTPKNAVMMIHGMPGTGKDSAVHYLSYVTRRPVAEVTFKPGTDIGPWFYTRSLDKEGTGWEYGHLWKVLTEGVKGRDGVARPAIVLLSDIDRADTAQAEWFRILCDSMGGRILDPHGKMVPLFPGTQFVCTANSVGSGDERGRMVSANPIDASILDRLGRKIKAHYLHWDDESRILRGKYPVLAEKCPEWFGDKNDAGQLGRATAVLRKAIEEEEFYAEFTHRGLCQILDECDDIVHFRGGTVPSGLLKKGFRAWLDGLDTDDVLAARRLIDPHLKGGAFSEGED